MSRVGKNSTLVKGFIHEGKDIPLEQGLKKRILDIYCPKKIKQEQDYLNEIRWKQGDHPLSITTGEMASALDRLSWGKSSGVDGMHDLLLHEASKD